MFLFFFFAGLSDGSISSFNIGLWSAVLGGIVAILGGSLLLRSTRMPRLANGLLLLLALPGVLTGLLLLAFVVLQPDMR
ncbi:MAG TPA: hypothetical protein VFW75_07880 [Acetobacteraceae bacterium]|nr:hypothetical protein [Acetobacteraceae bacterium]